MSGLFIHPSVHRVDLIDCRSLLVHIAIDIKCQCLASYFNFHFGFSCLPGVITQLLRYRGIKKGDDEKEEGSEEEDTNQEDCSACRMVDMELFEKTR